MVDKLWHSTLEQPATYCWIYVLPDHSGSSCFMATTKTVFNFVGKWCYLKDLLDIAADSTVLQKKLDKAMEALEFVRAHGLGDVFACAARTIREIEDIKE